MDWSRIKSGSVTRGMQRGLAIDLVLSHSEVIDIIRETLSNGVLSTGEQADLIYISQASRSMEPRSRELLRAFVSDSRWAAGSGMFRLPLRTHVQAADMVCDFLQRSGKGYFPTLSRQEIGVGLLMRIANSSLIRQSEASLCGPAALLFNIAMDNPVSYARFAIDLFEKGRARLGRISVEPGSDLRSYVIPEQKINQADWLTLASLRDSENFLLDYDSMEKELAGATTAGALADWFRRAGYHDVVDESNLLINKGRDSINTTNRAFEAGYRVCMIINANMLDLLDYVMPGPSADHWVVLRSKIDRVGGNLKIDRTCRGFVEGLAVSVAKVDGKWACILPGDEPDNAQCFWVSSEAL